MKPEIETNAVHDRTNDNVIVQLLKAADSDENAFEVVLNDDSRILVEHNDAQRALNVLMAIKSTTRRELMIRMQASIQAFNEQFSQLLH